MFADPFIKDFNAEFFKQNNSNIKFLNKDLTKQNHIDFYTEFRYAKGSIVSLSDIEILTNEIINTIVNDYDIKVKTRLIDGPYFGTFIIDGDSSGNFVTLEESFQEVVPGANELKKVEIASEYVIVSHDNKSYIFGFSSFPDKFDSPTVTNIREHMFNSITWLN